MGEGILQGRGRRIIEVPRGEWEERLSQVLQHHEIRLGFMSEEHHRVRNLVVRDMPRLGKSIQPEYISQELGLPMARLGELLNELEEKLFFLVRNAQGSVSWAFPVTVDHTPHHATFSTGESLYAA